jgi:O-antigen/teichoic acid export membrane protein
VLSLFGPEFEVGAPALVALAIGQFLAVTFGMAARLLMMSGHGKDLRRVVAVAATVNVALCLALVPNGGILGAALATAASWLVNNVLAAITVRRKVGVSTHVLARLSRS